MPAPFRTDGAIHYDQLRDLSGSLAAHRVHPAVLGGMGEFYALNLAEATVCMEAAVDGAGGRVPVVAGIGHDTRAARLLAKAAAATGIAVIVANPLYYANPSPRGYADHIRAIAEESGLPVIIYSAPSYPATDAVIDTMIDIEGFAGVKEEYYGIPETAVRISHWGDRLQWWGVGEQVGSDFAAVGASTVTTSLANIDPEAAVGYISARLEGRRPDPTDVALVTAWEAAMSASSEGAPSFLKEAMRQFSGWSHSVRLPLRPIDSNGRTQAAIAEIITTSRARREQNEAVSA
jgi:dihydrodipicolinate synthase/N-acetylneuraminate lyase